MCFKEKIQVSYTSITYCLYSTCLYSKGLTLQVEKIEQQGLKVTTFVAKNMMAKLAEATNRTEQLYGMDVNITYRVIKHVLDYEVLQSGLNLTHTQDRNFIQVSVVFNRIKNCFPNVSIRTKQNIVFTFALLYFL